MNNAANTPLNVFNTFFGDIGAGAEAQQRINDLVPSIIYIYDVNSKKLSYVNKRMTDILGYTLDDITGLDTITHKDDAAAVAETIEKLIALQDSESCAYNSRLNHKGGHWKYFRTTGSVLKRDDKGGATAFLFIAEDITSTLETEAAYQELLNYKQMTLEKERFLESGSWEIDLATGKIKWSDGMYGLFEYDITDGTMPELTADLYFTHFSAAEIEDIKKDWRQMLDGGENYARQETIIAKNGEKKRLETYGKVIRNNNGEAIKVMGATKDVSRLKEYERQLEKKVQELERSNKELEEFAYVASHDLQEPLRKISTFSERLKLKFENELSEDGKGYITRMLNAAANMRMLIENLLNFSRLTVKKVEYVNTDMNNLLDEVLTEIELQVDDTHTSIKRDKLPELEVIPSQVKQLFSNIILNAIKFKKQDVDPVIEIKSIPLTADEKENYYLQANVPYYAISISDNGIGFEQEYAEKIFQIFQRLHGKSEYPGAGIGLAICKKIVDNHHGKLFADGRPGEGATFTMILPEKNN